MRHRACHAVRADAGDRVRWQNVIGLAAIPLSLTLLTDRRSPDPLAAELLGSAPNAGWLELSDRRRGVLRVAIVSDGARKGRLFLARDSGAGARIRACFGVTRDAIRHTVATHDLRDVKQIGALLRAGTNCGSCIPEMEEILRDVRIQAE